MKDYKNYLPKYPLIWQKDDLYFKVFCSIPNVATGIILRTQNSIFIIDPGDGILRDLKRELKTPDILKISNVFISHGHHDHVGGLWSFLTYLSVMNKSTPLNLYYPEGCIEIESIFRAFNEVYGRELSYEICLFPLNKAETIVTEGVSVKPFKVNHREAVPGSKRSVEVPSIGFNFAYNKLNICYGGDTAYCDSLVQMAKDSDLAVIEAGALDEEESELHMTFKQAISVGKTAKEFFLVHVPE
ncbi:MAG: MBL fold metallo-hydrolase [Ignavibacteriales bacterium]|nr:MBL fold metallo-hydrolase [Ignavibacteriales bacterium]MCF8305369.1 MBL fold metallo-hydrolase [Ignavibacteriales bacterium]MCF8316052.1 MBL fold metallo-hydrolase [Ignavibacteriales bacterium]MCF8436554.1 MBL fold metallo-hydrolase [Ignavibacteriales bacterium]